MKKEDLKKAIKPLVKECINEILIEEGLLSSVVSEVARGLQPVLPPTHRVEPPPAQISTREQATKTRKKINEQRKRLMDSIGGDAYNGVDLFENTAPLTQRESTAPRPGTVDLGSAADSGVDISSLVGNASQVWKAIK